MLHRRQGRCPKLCSFWTLHMLRYDRWFQSFQSVSAGITPRVRKAIVWRQRRKSDWAIARCASGLVLPCFGQDAWSDRAIVICYRVRISGWYGSVCERSLTLALSPKIRPSQHVEGSYTNVFSDDLTRIRVHCAICVRQVQLGEYMSTGLVAKLIGTWPVQEYLNFLVPKGMNKFRDLLNTWTAVLGKWLVRFVTLTCAG